MLKSKQFYKIRGLENYIRFLRDNFVFEHVNTKGTNARILYKFINLMKYVDIGYYARVKQKRFVIIEEFVPYA